MPITPETLLNAYVNGAFPMADSATSTQIKWYQPQMRGQLPIADLHISKSLLKTIKSHPYAVKINTAFEGTMRACGTTSKRPDTWINEEIIHAFCALHNLGHAHSVEIWQNETLVGGLYGLSIGGAFCGESMFSRKPNTSKVALVHLCARLYAGGFTILDTQFLNDHLMQFGAYEIPHEDYLSALHKTFESDTDFLQASTPEDIILRGYLNHRNQ